MGKVLLFTQNERNLIGVDNKNRVKLWKKSSLNNYINLNEINQTVKSISLLENDLLAIGSCDINKIEIWNITSQTKISTLNDHTNCVNTMFSVKIFKKSYLITGAADTTIRLYDNNFNRLQTLKEHTGSLIKLNYSPYLSMIVSNSSDNKIKFWMLANKLSIEIKQAHSSTVRAIVVLENGYIATASDDEKIKVWKKEMKIHLI